MDDSGTGSMDDAVVDQASAESATTASPGSTGHDALEVAATVLLGIAAVLIAWSAYQSSLWGGLQDKALTNSVNTTTQSVDLLQVADTTRALDQTLFIQIFTSGACDEGGDEFVCDQIFANLSPEGEEAVNAWFENDDLVPFDSEAYVDSLYGEGQELADDAEAFFEEASEANGNSDDHELAATILTIALFFAGVSIVINSRRVRVALLVTAGGFVAAGAVFLVTLPRA